MNEQTTKQIEKSGIKMTKDKLIELIRKSSSREFSIAQLPNSKTIIVVIN